MEKVTKQQAVTEALEVLLDQVKEGGFGKDNNFDKDAFEDSFDDDVLIQAYVYE